MRIRYLNAALATAAIASVAVRQPATAQNSPASPGPAATSHAAPATAEPVDRLLRQMSAYIGSADEFTFHADILFDHVLPSGQKLQFAAAQEVALQRPGRLYIEYRGDLGDRQFWYDGKSITLFDPATSFYASEAAPAQIDAMLEKVMKDLDFSPPLADFLFKDPYQTVRANVQYGFDLGVTHVNGESCRALGFVEKDIDWQIWISEGPQLTPCKVVITYKTQPSQPQFSAVFTEWNFSPRIAEPVFIAVVPPGTRQIPFETAAATSVK
jgi:hypothetical protein